MAVEGVGRQGREDQPQFGQAAVLGRPEKEAAKPRRKGERPVGGVPGHKGSTRERVDSPDRVEELRPHGFCHFDESGMRVNGTLSGLHVEATGTAVHYTAHPRRGREAMDAAAGILPGFQGIAVHDHWKPYRVYTHCSHALCNAHHLREPAYCEELTGHWWPVELCRVLLDAKEAVAAGQTALEPAQMASLQARYGEQVKVGLDAWPVRPPGPGGKKGPAKQHDATNLLLRLRDYKAQVLRFLNDWRVPFDNNLAERRVRPVEVKLKVTGGFRAVG